MVIFIQQIYLNLRQFETGFILNGQDLNQIFAPYISGTKAPPTGFLVGSNSNDLCNIFDSIT